MSEEPRRVPDFTPFLLTPQRWKDTEAKVLSNVRSFQGEAQGYAARAILDNFKNTLLMAPEEPPRTSEEPRYPKPSGRSVHQRLPPQAPRQFQRDVRPTFPAAPKAAGKTSAPPRVLVINASGNALPRLSPQGIKIRVVNNNRLSPDAATYPHAVIVTCNREADHKAISALRPTFQHLVVVHVAAQEDLDKDSAIAAALGRQGIRMRPMLPADNGAKKAKLEAIIGGEVEKVARPRGTGATRLPENGRKRAPEDGPGKKGSEDRSPAPKTRPGSRSTVQMGFGSGTSTKGAIAQNEPRYVQLEEEGEEGEKRAETLAKQALTDDGGQQNLGDDEQQVQEEAFADNGGNGTKTHQGQKEGDGGVDSDDSYIDHDDDGDKDQGTTGGETPTETTSTTPPSTPKPAGHSQHRLVDVDELMQQKVPPTPQSDADM